MKVVKNSKRGIRLISILLLSATLAASCIKENRDGCPEEGGVSLYYLYKGDGNAEIFFQKIRNMHLFVYSEEGKLILDETIASSTMGEVPITWLNLPEGKYKIFCFGNTFINTAFKDISQLASAELSAANLYSSLPVTSNDSLYYGYTQLEVGTRGQLVDTVDLMSFHTKCYVYYQGLSPIVSSAAGKAAIAKSPYYIRINGVPASYSFLKNLWSNEKAYQPEEGYDEANKLYRYTLNLLKIKISNEITVEIVDRTSEEVLFTLNVKKYIEENNLLEKIYNRQEVPLGVIFRFSNLDVKVEPWDEEIITPGTGD